MENTFSPLSTNCGTCIFLDKEKHCRVERLNFYKSKGIQIIESDNKAPIIQDLICPYHRDLNWAKSLPDNAHVVNTIEKENRIPYYAIVFNMGKLLLKLSINRLLEFKHQPTQIYIVTSIDNPDLTIPEAKTLFEGSKVKWTIINEIEENAWTNIFKNYNQTDFMLLVNGFPYAKLDWAQKLSDQIQHNLLQFSYAVNAKRTMKLIPAYMYNSYYFEYTGKWLEKLTEERCHQKYIF